MPAIVHRLPERAQAGEVTSREQALADKVSLAGTNFAKSGNPSNKLMPDRKPYNAKERPIMVIDDQPKLVNDPLHDSRVIISEMRGKYQTIRWSSNSPAVTTPPFRSVAAVL